MAPTICSEKKQMRVAGLKETRRHNGPANTTAASSSSSAAGAMQASSVLSYIANGSMNSSVRRRQARMQVQRRLPQISDSDVSSSLSSPSTFSRDSDLDMETDRESNEYTVHSTSSSKSVLQPTMANININNSNSFSNRTPMAKLCDEEDNLLPEEDDDGDSGYAFALEPVKLHHQNGEGLLSIALKTIKLVQRNNLLQKRLAQLQLETSEFIASVLANPENSHFQITSKTEAKMSNMLLRH